MFYYQVAVLLPHSLGDVYIADYGNHRIRKVTISTGIITTYAGTGSATFSGDGGVATAAALYLPSGVAVDSAGKHVLLLSNFGIYALFN